MQVSSRTGPTVHSPQKRAGFQSHRRPALAPARRVGKSDAMGHARAHGHGHPHLHGRDTRSRRTIRALLAALVLNSGFLVLEAVVGLITGSLALLSDAAHMVSDVGALLLALVAAQLARAAATPHRSFGWARAETLGAFVNGMALLVACGFIFKEAIARLVAGPPLIDPLPVLLVGCAGLAINLGSAFFLHRAGGRNLNVRAALVHMLADALGSVGAILSALLVAWGWPAADPVVSLLIGVLVLWATWGLLRESMRILLQFAPAGLSGADIERELRQLPGLADVHDLHVWSLSSEQSILSAHLVIARDAAPDAVRRDAAEVLAERFGITHSTLQVELDGACTSPGCPLGEC